RMIDFCAVMSGVRTSIKQSVNPEVVLNTAKPEETNIIFTAAGAIFLKLQYRGVPVFLSTSAHIVDLDTELVTQNFDVREYFSSAVPLVLYIKWAFAATSWASAETGACLIIDDPLLKPRHGFVDFQ